MGGKIHTYRVAVEWIGNRGNGTSGIARYGRDHTISAGAKPPIAGSSDPAFLGDRDRWNPEDLLLASISACHKLWYLGLCANAGVVVTSYHDEAEATMLEEANGAGRFLNATLRPRITIQRAGDVNEATRLHHAAHEYCFIANSVNFPIVCEPDIRVESDAADPIAVTAAAPPS
jgi:organic hydroperoxide reductase OsmC/OhrA